MDKNNITLIAPSGAGKSTFGKKLSERTGQNFIDFDDDILENIDLQTAESFCKEYNIKKDSGIYPSILVNTSVSELLELLGEDLFKKLEEYMTLKLNLESDTILATSGSQIYSEEAMKFLDKISTIIYLEVPLEEITKRFHAMKVDRIIGMGNSKNKEKYIEIMKERIDLYERYAEYKFKLKKSNEKNKQKRIEFSFNKFYKFLKEKGIVKL